VVSPPPFTGATEEYDGTTWATNPTGLNTARAFLAGCGTQTAGLGFGGKFQVLLHNNCNRRIRWKLGHFSRKFKYSKRILAGCGTQTAALAFGGYDTTATGATEEYDGATWTSNPTGLNTARYALAGCGTQTAGLAFGGYMATANTGANRRI
jgi:hypothetical protein